VTTFRPEMFTPAVRAAVEKSLYERSFYAFLKAAWPYFDPSEFIPGWHLGCIADHLEAVSNGQIRRLLINIPPRHSKTIMVSIAWPVWTWIQQPDKDFPLKRPGVRFLCASYGATKAQSDAVTSRRLIGSKWFQDRWGDRVRIDGRDNQEQFDNSAGGYRISTGIPESLGKGGAVRIIDDPHKNSEVESKEVIASQIRAYDEVWRTRSNDPKYGAEVIIMQRLNEADLSGHLLTNDFESVVHLYLPERFESDRRCVTVIGFEDPRQRDGQLLWPQRFNDEWATQQEKSLGDYAWSAQFQQRPAPRGGGIFKREWWVPYGPWRDDKGVIHRHADPHVGWGQMVDPIKYRVEFPKCEIRIAIVDTALTERATNDPSALVVLGVWIDPNSGFSQVMLIYAWQKWVQLSDLVKEVRLSCDKYDVHWLLIENRTVGLPVYNELRKCWAERRGTWTMDLIEASSAKGGKEIRAHAVTHLFQEA
jgi:hypothetical protein